MFETPLPMGRKLSILANPTPALPLPRGGSYSMDENISPKVMIKRTEISPVQGFPPLGKGRVRVGSGKIANLRSRFKNFSNKP
jgi:hypothetical protein